MGEVYYQMVVTVREGEVLEAHANGYDTGAGDEACQSWVLFDESPTARAPIGDGRVVELLGEVMRASRGSRSWQP